MIILGVYESGIAEFHEIQKRGSHMTTMHNYNNLIIGCVAENTPKYLSQALRLLQSIRWFGGKIADVKFIVCVVDGCDPVYKAEFEKYVAEVRIVERFSEKHPPSNKLRFLQQPDLQEYQHILLLDCDTLVVQDPSLYLQADGFRAKIADGPTTPSHRFKELFDYFQLPMPAEDFNCSVRGTPTVPYFNAGVLLFSQAAMNDLVPAWVKLNEELIKNMGTLLPGSYAFFCEQASLCLAIVESGTKFDVFGNAMNFPIHHESYINLLEGIDPLIIHYHNLVDSSGYISPSKYPLANKRITQFNDRLRRDRDGNC